MDNNRKTGVKEKILPIENEIEKESVY